VIALIFSFYLQFLLSVKNIFENKFKRFNF